MNTQRNGKRRSRRDRGGVRVIYEHDPRFTTPTRIYVTTTGERRDRTQGGAR